MVISRRAALLAALLVTTCLVGCASRPGVLVRPSEMIAYDLGILLPAGTLWKGTLTYRNYSDNKSITIPSTFLLTRVDTENHANAAFIFAIGYDEEPHANSASRLEIREQGKVIALGDSIERVISHERVGDGVVIVTQSTGTDDNKPASIRKVYSIAPAACSMQKLVKFADGGDWIERHVYRWTR